MVHTLAILFKVGETRGERSGETMELAGKTLLGAGVGRRWLWSRLGDPPTLAPVVPVVPRMVPMGTIVLKPLKVSINFVTWDFVIKFFYLRLGFKG